MRLLNLGVGDAKDAKSAEWKVGMLIHFKTRILSRNGWMGEALLMGSESSGDAVFEGGD